MKRKQLTDYEYRYADVARMQPSQRRSDALLDLWREDHHAYWLAAEDQYREGVDL